MIKKLKSSLLKLLHFFVLISFFLYTNPAFSEAVKRTCIKTGSVCVDGPSTKMINGVSVYKACWQYKDAYECLEPNAADYCAPLKKNEAKCVVEGQSCLEKGPSGECLRYTNQYSCDIDIKTLNKGTLPTNITELLPTHLITSDWDMSKCRSADKDCKQVSEKCIEGPSTKVINGVAVTKECWKKELQMQCATGENDNQCKVLEETNGCVLKGERCIFNLPDGSCQVKEKVYTCIEREAGTEVVSSCEDRDFSKAMTTMEMAREMQRYYDPENQRFFNGEANKCSIKLGGSLDGWMGGDCCKTDAKAADMKDWLIMAGTEKAIENALTSVASQYTYTLLTNNVSTAVGNTLANIGAANAAAGGVQGLSMMGVTASMQGGQMVVMFDPTSFAIAIAMMALQSWLSCGQEEVLTAMKRQANLCHHVGSYCSSKVLGVCVKKVESQCCYVSKLAKIINVGGKDQLQTGWGSAKNPTCEGFTAQELEKLDFSKLDMQEFYDEIYTNMNNLTKQSNTAVKNSQSRINKQGKSTQGNYYDD